MVFTPNPTFDSVRAGQMQMISVKQNILWRIFSNLLSGSKTLYSFAHDSALNLEKVIVLKIGTNFTNWDSVTTK